MTKQQKNRKKNHKLVYADRLLLEQLLEEKTKIVDIAEILGVSRYTIHNEIKRGQHKGKYSADVAQKNLFT